MSDQPQPRVTIGTVLDRTIQYWPAILAVVGVMALGALLAIGLVQYGFALLRPEVNQLASLYQSSVSVLGLDIAQSGTIVAAGVLLGLTGSWFAAARHMRAIEPR